MEKGTWEYIQSDFARYGQKPTIKNILISVLLAKNHCLAFCFWLRVCSQKNVFYPLAKIMHYRLSRKYGLLIQPQTKIGYGIYLGHGIGIVIHPTAIIGNNCNLSQFTTIGSNKGKAAILGDNVYVGPSVCIIEDVRIGNNISIGAGAVVTKDIPDNATVAGVPAKIISYNNPGGHIRNRWG